MDGLRFTFTTPPLGHTTVVAPTLPPAPPPPVTAAVTVAAAAADDGGGGRTAESQTRGGGGGLAAELIECAEHVSRCMGEGHSESVYQRALAIECGARGFEALMEYNVPYTFRPSSSSGSSDSNMVVGMGRIDLLVRAPSSASWSVVELKTQPRSICAEHDPSRHQVQRYVRALRDMGTSVRETLVLNFRPSTAGRSAELEHIVEAIASP